MKKSASERIADALELANRYGGIDGSHHKTWVIDQIVRALTGSPEAYREWIEKHNVGADGPDTYDWPEGTAP